MKIKNYYPSGVGGGLVVFNGFQQPQTLAAIMRHANLLAAMPGSTRQQSFREAWAYARRRAGDLIHIEPETLRQFVRRVGGIKPGRYNIPLCFLNRGGISASDMAFYAHDCGYATESDPEILSEMLRDGEKHYALNDLDVLKLQR